MISHGVEISIAGGGADEKDGGRRGRRGPYIDFADAVHFDDCESYRLDCTSRECDLGCTAMS